ncbi:type I pullulanase [Paenibacillus motobuensis]|uniref:type I pullulanase n=1 Tax=Paenibacillus TaxID=44249 RepID=UPI00204203C3|nr:type I pullulanase [Paenibacillus lutimineralis]MCM3649869.1 type I pullulanase [Paenibacillus motobuensis]
MSVQKEMDMVTDYGDLAVTDGISVFDPKFDEAFYYDGDDLGVTYTPEQTTFRLWAPTASEASVMIYDSSDGALVERKPMARDVHGTWVLTVNGDCNHWYYTFGVQVGGQWNEAVDPYAKAVGVNGDRGVVLDLSSTRPQRWTEDRPLLAAPVDAVIYELHVKDLSIHPQSGSSYPGKFLGLAESGTTGPNGIPTGLDYISGLGVTHVQLLPVYDYATESVDETKPELPQYNWGYDPKNYNVPEGSYATDPYSPELRIRELKQTIQALHDRGIRVIMDVVYNHVYDGYLVNFTKLVPGYYLRYKEDGTFSNGSFCGNECASERAMMSKFIVDSVVYWAQEYHMDGFRFDLMGLMDIATMNEIRYRLDKIDPSIMMIGEGWVMDTVLPEAQRANQSNAALLPRIGQFNDGFRDTVKGDIFVYSLKGFVSLGRGFEEKVKRGIVGGIKYKGAIAQYATEPDQTVNYVECHDNHTLWDKLVLSTDSHTDEERRSMHRLASAMVLTSQGIPFIHAGQEFMRTKQGVENSYKSSIEINQMDWQRCAEHQSDVLYMCSLIKLRQSHPAFRLRTAREIRRHLHFEQAPDHAIAYTLRNHAGGDPNRHLYVLYNANPEPTTLQLPELGDWEVHFGKEHVISLKQQQIQVHGVGMVVLAVHA